MIAIQFRNIDRFVIQIMVWSIILKWHWLSRIVTGLLLSLTLLVAGEKIIFDSTVAQALTEYQFLFSDADEEFVRGSWDDMPSYLNDMGVRSKYFILRQSKVKTAAVKIYNTHLKNLARQTYLAYHFVMAHPK